MKTGEKIGKLTAVPTTAASAIKLGAIVGGTLSMIQNTYRVSQGRINAREAAANVAKDTVGTGLSTAVGAVVVTGLGVSGLLGIVGFMTISGLSKELWDTVAHGKNKIKEIEETT